MGYLRSFLERYTPNASHYLSDNLRAKLHALLSENLLPDSAAGGRLRRTDMAIAASVFQPLGIGQLIEECFDLLLAKAQAIDDVFAWAYERSCQRYTVLRESLPTPDPLRLRHREVLRALVDPVDVEPVVALTINELHQLHQGNIARYRLRPSQFRDWLAAQ